MVNEYCFRAKVFFYPLFYYLFAKSADGLLPARQLLAHDAALDSSAFTYLSVLDSVNGQQRLIVVNLVTSRANGSYWLWMDGEMNKDDAEKGSGNNSSAKIHRRPFLFEYSITSDSSKASTTRGIDRGSSYSKYVYRAEIETSRGGSVGERRIEYSIEGIGERRPTFAQNPFNRNGGYEPVASLFYNNTRANTQTNDLVVCMFGDYRHDWMQNGGRLVNLSRYAEDSACNLNLFIGRVVFEESCSAKSSSSTSQLSFNPYIMLHEPASRSVFATVPSVFGGVGHGLQTTPIFYSVEIGGVVFIQYTIEVKTTLMSLHPDFDERKLYAYFEELMTAEMECKLKELYLRGNERPWIVVYLTHPSMFREKKGKAFYLNSYPRLFELFDQYPIDLLLVCEESELLAVHERMSLDATRNTTLPRYLLTTFVECAAPTTSYNLDFNQKCNYAVLTVDKSYLSYAKKSLSGETLEDGLVERRQSDRLQVDEELCRPSLVLTSISQ